MNYPEAIRYLLSFADFERSGRFQDRPDVAPMLALLHALGDPHLGRPTIHVAGSKGKGSICAMVESVLRASGRRTGLYTSPHLHEYTERIRIGGEPVSEADFARLTAALREAVDRVLPTLAGRSFVTFDLLTALGFLAFREAAVDVQVIEVGLGGRVDSTNVFAAKEVAVIAPLSYEHTAILGDTIPQIAAEKAAIITAGCTAVLAPQEYPEARNVVLARAQSAGARLVDVETAYRWRVLAHDTRTQEVEVTPAQSPLPARPEALEGPAEHNSSPPENAIRFRLPLLGAHQAENAATAVAVIEALVGAGLKPAPTRNDIVRGLASVHWPGRLEVLRERPLIVADGAHNRDSARRLFEALRDHFGHERATFVVGAGSDKDIEGLADELAPAAERVIAARADHPRAMAPEHIAEAFRARGVPCEVAESVPAAIERALAVTDAGRLICLAGSLFVAAEGRAYLGAPDR